MTISRHLFEKAFILFGIAEVVVDEFYLMLYFNALRNHIPDSRVDVKADQAFS